MIRAARAKLLMFVMLPLLIIVFAAMPMPFAQAAPVAIQTTISELTSNGSDYHGRYVCFTGEAIGDAIIGYEDNYWLTLSDGKGSISVSVSAEMLDDVTMFGRYQVTGDIIEITGSYHVSCEDHGGPSDVHATALKVLRTGSVVSQPIEFTLFVVGVILALVGGVFAMVYRLLIERSR